MSLLDAPVRVYPDREEDSSNPTAQSGFKDTKIAGPWTCSPREVFEIRIPREYVSPHAVFELEREKLFRLGGEFAGKLLENVLAETADESLYRVFATNAAAFDTRVTMAGTERWCSAKRI